MPGVDRRYLALLGSINVGGNRIAMADLRLALEQVRAAIDENPFHGTGPQHGSDKMVHSIFLSRQPDRADFDQLVADHRARGGERLAMGDRVLFLDYVHGVGVSDLSNKTLERRLRCRGTARNMNSLKNLLSKMT